MLSFNDVDKYATQDGRVKPNKGKASKMDLTDRASSHEVSELNVSF